MADAVQYTYRMRIASIGPRSRVVSARKLPDGTMETTRENLGHFVTLDPGGISFRLGDDQSPEDWTVGVEVEVIVRRRPL